MTPWIYGGASVANSRGYDCEDYFCFKDLSQFVGQSAFVVCVADGAGSKPQALAGAKRACRAIATAVADCYEMFSIGTGAEPKLVASDFINWLSSNLEALEQELTAENSKNSVLDYSSTILSVVVLPTETLFFQVGDGAIIYSERDDPDDFKLACMPQKGEYANEALMVTSDSMQKEAFFMRLDEPIARLCLFSDGVEDAFVDFQNEGVIDASFKKVFPFIEQRYPSQNDLSAMIEATLMKEPLSKSSKDDKTLIYCTHVP